MQDDRHDSRRAFDQFLERRDLNPYALARKAGISVSALYNFQSGATKNLSTKILRKIADATGSSIEEIIGGAGPAPEVPVTHTVGAFGRMIETNGGATIIRPPGAGNDDLQAAVISGPGLHPLPEGWAVFFWTKPSDPAALIGKLAVVRVAGQTMVREIRRGSSPGLYDLHAWSAPPIEDAVIDSAHKVVSFSER